MKASDAIRAIVQHIIDQRELAPKGSAIGVDPANVEEDMPLPTLSMTLKKLEKDYEAIQITNLPVDDPELANGDYDPLDDRPLQEKRCYIITLTERFDEIAQKYVAPADKPLANRERDTLYKLVIGMAIRGYRYDPKAKKNDAVSDIASDLELLGIPLDKNTIRKWLNQAGELVPQVTESKHPKT